MFRQGRYICQLCIYLFPSIHYDIYLLYEQEAQFGANYG